MLVGWRTSRLNDENVTAANILLDLDVSFAIGERTDRRLPERRTNVITDALRQLAIGGAAENLHLGLERKHILEGR